jgi:prepilin signal peptidase PulO-like enzyme (type II secretory pathway)
MIGIAILFGILGLILGTAAVHLAEAALAKRQLTSPYCSFCAAPLAPVQWNATLSLITGQARCRSCDRFLRIPRLLGELFPAVAWALIAARFGLRPRALLAMAALIPLVMILVTDLEVKLVPNRIMLPAIVAMLVVGTAVGPALPGLQAWRWWQTLAGAATGFAVFRVLVWIGVAIFGEGALGEGDITLAAYCGAVVGFPLVVESLVLAFALGGVGALLILISRRGRLDTAIPYGPYIILGCALTQIWGVEILAWFLR